MKTYKIYGNYEEWCIFPPDWVYLETVKAKSPKLAIQKTVQKKLISPAWRCSDLKAVLKKT